MVKQEELPLLISMIRSVISKSRGLDFSHLTIEIDRIEDVGDAEIVEGQWTHFILGGRFSVKIKKDDKNIISLRID